MTLVALTLRGDGAGAGAGFGGFSDIFEAMFSGGFGAHPLRARLRVRRGTGQAGDRRHHPGGRRVRSAKEAFDTHVLCDVCNGSMCQVRLHERLPRLGFVTQIQNSLLRSRRRRLLPVVSG